MWRCKWLNLVANLEPLQVMLSDSQILKFKVAASSDELNTLGPLCPWQCFLMTSHKKVKINSRNRPDEKKY